MRQFELLQAMTFRSGRFKLTPEQYRRRRHVTTLLDAEQLIVEPNPDISFKLGEIIETDLDVPRAIESKLRPLTPEQPAAEANSSEPQPVVNTDPAASDSSVDSAGGSATGAPAVDEAKGTDDPLGDIDIGGDTDNSAAPVAPAVDQKPGKPKRGK